ncbi:hypothetical protein BCR43DRAFT_482096 [Syncephalastrum racemosum]|uniref:Signal recognition particle subunit SRP68 n=1 Tax=Syncephalastrum racemosum TaxID=13706 RepID=A0A1X2HT15_SYNRA|nr:hypothetical protein BCR43DRAFT_482096 [Syncephalastrum racemosum]
MDSNHPLTVDVLGLINESRLAYGLRHQDYQRYREYCTHRVHRLRQMLRLAQPNKQKMKQEKELPEATDDPRYLHLFIFDVERAWAYAMELKQDASSSSGLRKRHHWIKRLKRASAIAQSLCDLCEKYNADTRTLLHVKAYYETMTGYLFFEQETWKEALDAFISARTIYDRFASTLNNARQEALCNSAIDEIDPNIRFCAYKLNNGEVSSSGDMSSLVRELQGQQLSDLDARFSAIQADNTDQQVMRLQWRERECSIKHDGLAQLLSKAQTSAKLLDKNETDQDVVALFEKALTHWADAEKLAKRVLQEDKDATAEITSSKSAKSTEDLQYIYAYVAYNLYSRSIQRNQRLADHIQRQNGRPQDVVKLYDDILMNLETMKALQMVSEQDNRIEYELAVLDSFYRAKRCLAVADTYGSMDRVPESMALSQRAHSYCVQAKRTLQSFQGFSPDALLSVDVKAVTSFESHVRDSSMKARAAYTLAHGWQVEPDIEKTPKSKAQDALLQDLDSYPSSVSQKTLLVDIPPRFDAVSSKPFYFDLAANYVQYPSSLAQRAKPSGLLSKFFGFGG